MKQRTNILKYEIALTGGRAAAAAATTTTTTTTTTTILLYYYYYYNYYDYTVLSMISFKMVPHPLYSHHRPFIQFEIFNP